MMTKGHEPRMAVIAAVSVLLIMALAPAWVLAASPALPPRPTPLPTPTLPPTATLAPTPTALPTPTASPKPPVGGALIELRAQLGWSWLLKAIFWQQLCTAVEWQDGLGGWHTVEGWQGSLDDILFDAAGNLAGVKTWWVDKADLSKGPFRWTVYVCKSGEAVASSESFDLPRREGELTVIEVSLR